MITFHGGNNLQQAGRGWFKLPQRINHLGDLVSLYSQSSIFNRPSKSPSFADFYQDQGLKSVTAFGGYRKLEPMFSKKKFGNGILKTHN